MFIKVLRTVGYLISCKSFFVSSTVMDEMTELCGSAVPIMTSVGSISTMESLCCLRSCGTSSSSSSTGRTNYNRNHSRKLRSVMAILVMTTSTSNCATTSNLIASGSQFSTISSICMRHLSNDLVPIQLDDRFQECVGKLPPNIEVRFLANAFESPHYRYLRTISFAGNGYDVFNLVAVPRMGRSLPILGIDIVSLPRTCHSQPLFLFHLFTFPVFAATPYRCLRPYLSPPVSVPVYPTTPTSPLQINPSTESLSPSPFPFLTSPSFPTLLSATTPLTPQAAPLQPSTSSPTCPIGLPYSTPTPPTTHCSAATTNGTQSCPPGGSCPSTHNGSFPPMRCGPAYPQSHRSCWKTQSKITSAPMRKLWTIVIQIQNTR